MYINTQPGLVAKMKMVQSIFAVFHRKCRSVSVVLKQARKKQKKRNRSRPLLGRFSVKPATTCRSQHFKGFGEHVWVPYDMIEWRQAD